MPSDSGLPWASRCSVARGFQASVLLPSTLSCRTWRLASRFRCVVLHRHPIDAWTGRLLCQPEPQFERPNVDVMQQRREPGLAGTFRPPRSHARGSAARVVGAISVALRLPGVPIPSCRSPFSMAWFPSATSSIVWSGPTSICDAADWLSLVRRPRSTIPSTLMGFISVPESAFFGHGRGPSPRRERAGSRHNEELPR